MVLPFLLTLAACGGAGDCTPDERLDVDGDCVPYSGPQAADEDLVADLPDCELDSPGTRLDLGEECADGVCTWMDYEGMVEVLGEPTECHASGWFEDEVLCAWGDFEIYRSFEDADGDLVPDTNGEVKGLMVQVPYAGTSPDGLRPGLSMRCFLDAFGQPDDYEVEYEDARVLTSWAWYHDRDVGVADWATFEGGALTSYDSDGYADTLVFSEATNVYLIAL